MTDQLDPSIAETIAKRRAEIAQNESAQKQAEAARKAEQRALNHTAWDALEVFIQSWQPKLAPFWQRPADDEAPILGYPTMIEFTLPELAPFAAHFSYNNGEWQQTASRDGKYIVTRYNLEFKSPHSDRRKIDSRWWKSTNRLDDAIIEAQEQYQNRSQLQAELDRDNAERDQAEREREAMQIFAETAATAHQAHETTEREALLDLISDDPVAITLLKLFSAVKQERAGYQQAIDNLGESIGDVEERYTRKLSEAQRDAKANADRAYEAEIEATNARSSAATIERKFKQQSW
jgi:hypothetical protein